MKTNLPVFKDKQLKDAVTYHTGNGIWPFTGDQGAETEISYCTCTDLYRVFLESWLKALNKELYMLCQCYQEGMSKYGVGLAWHVQIIQTEFARCTRGEHLEGVKHDHFYKGLKEEHQVMLAHKMEDKHLATYAELLKAVRQIKK